MRGRKSPRIWAIWYDKVRRSARAIAPMRTWSCRLRRSQGRQPQRGCVPQPGVAPRHEGLPRESTPARRPNPERVASLGRAGAIAPAPPADAGRKAVRSPAFTRRGGREQDRLKPGLRAKMRAPRMPLGVHGAPGVRTLPAGDHRQGCRWHIALRADEGQMGCRAGQGPFSATVRREWDVKDLRRCGRLGEPSQPVGAAVPARRMRQARPRTTTRPVAAPSHPAFLGAVGVLVVHFLRRRGERWLPPGPLQAVGRRKRA